MGLSAIIGLILSALKTLVGIIGSLHKKQDAVQSAYQEVDKAKAEEAVTEEQLAREREKDAIQVDKDKSDADYWTGHKNWWKK